MESVLGSVGTKRALSPTSQSEGGRAKRTRWKTKRLRQAEEDQQQINEEEKEEEPEPFLVPRRPPAQGTTFLGPRNQVAFAPCSELNDNHIQVDIEMQMEQIHQGTETSEDFARFEKTRQNNDWHPSQKERVPGINFALEAKTIPTEKGSLKVMKGPELNIGHFQKEGFSHPLLVPNPAGLGLSAPGGSSSSSNMIRGIRRMVGSRVTMEVLDQTTHKVSSMTMKYWKRYFLTEPRQREQSLSVPGLEFSGTPFGSKIKSPRLVRQLDWLDRAWPRYLRGLITPQDCPREDWLYPRVRKTLSMFSQGSWNEFKIAPGGSSTWLHLLSGRLVYFLIEPTAANHEIYRKWVLSGDSLKGFGTLGDLVQKHEQVELSERQTLFVPSGWIVASYAASDSIVIGGHFLHSFSVEMQLKVSRLEQSISTPTKLTYPFFTEILWYVLDRYVHCLNGKTQLSFPEEEKKRIRLMKGEGYDADRDLFHVAVAGKQGGPETATFQEHVHLTRMELQGICCILLYLSELPAAKKDVPVLLKDPVQIVKGVKDIISRHRGDSPEKALTGFCVLRWSDSDIFAKEEDEEERQEKDNDWNAKGSASEISRKADGGFGGPSQQGDSAPSAPGGKVRKGYTMLGGARKRKMRCKKCANCTRDDCRECIYCKDMSKYGGPQVMKQGCIHRKCLDPIGPGGRPS